MANLALFDLDMTLLNVDSDHSWGQFLVERGLVDSEFYQSMNDKFYQDYIKGVLDAVEYNEFVASFLKTKTMSQLCAYRDEYLSTWIKPAMRPKAIECISWHKAQGDTVLVISATNDFVVVPIASLFGVDNAHTLATRLEVVDNAYTGGVADLPNFKDGKIFHLKNWIKNANSNGIYFDELIAYSDSKNDLPLLNFANKAVCVNPDEVLKTHAIEQGWDVVDWRI
ncbi:MAG: HAD family hydrolase [Moraxella sp.]|nr:HAD family hydrolase [Moraxella sp.]